MSIKYNYKQDFDLLSVNSYYYNYLKDNYSIDYIKKTLTNNLSDLLL